MRKDAEGHAGDDQKLRSLIETRNRADAAMYNAEHFMHASAEKISATSLQEVEQAVARLRTAVQGRDVGEIESLTKNLDLALELVGSFLETVEPNPGSNLPNPGSNLPNPDAKTAPFYGINP
jgi:molecular chaperone DnaK